MLKRLGEKSWRDARGERAHGWLRRRAAAEVRTTLGAERIVAIDERANSFGLESAGTAQIRGNGCLAATADELLFVMWVPRRRLRIPRERITAVERATSHLGKTIGHPLLRVRFTDERAAPDAVAWFVNDLPIWETVLAS